MFGMGSPAKEKAVINGFAAQFQSIGLDRSQATDSATNLVDEVLEVRRSRGIDPFKTTQGDEYALREDFTAPRIAAGLTVTDIRAHWNRPLLVVMCEVKARELINFIVIPIAEQQGKDLVAAGDQYKKTFPRYGDPREVGSQ